MAEELLKLFSRVGVPKEILTEGRQRQGYILLLIAYREVPHTSTGFSPFDLLYGRHVRGPLDILKETRQVSEKSEEIVVSYILSIRDKY